MTPKQSILSTLTLRQKIELLATARANSLGRDTEAEKRRRTWVRKCQTDFTAFATEALRPAGFRPAKHHRLLITHLEQVLSGETKRLLVTMPPGSAKSTYTSQLFPVFAMQRRPRIRIIGASHTTGLAMDFSAKVQDFIRENQHILTYGLRSESKERWSTTNGCSYLAAGVGTAIPGYRADIGIIDDPVKGPEAADSEADRKRVWDWYIGAFERRLTPGASIILILTRWNQDDLAGRLLDVQPEKWTHVDLPAEAGEDDALGREPGEWLWSDDDYGYGAELAGIKADLEQAGATREWSSQYQQEPSPAEGLVFKTHMIDTIPAAPAGGRSVRAYDLAATRDVGKRDPAWTRGVRLALMPNRRLVVEDVVGIRGGPDEVDRLIYSTAQRDGRGVVIGLPRDPGQAGVVQISHLTKMLHGFTVKSSPEAGDKVSRAGPIASQVNVGNVDVVAGSWNRSFLEELAAFPAGSKMDQVDALSRAYGMLLETGRPIILSPQQIIAVHQMQSRNRQGGMGARNRFVRVR